MANAGKTVFVQFTKVRSIHQGFYKWKMKDDNQKKFLPKIAIDTDLLDSAFANCCKNNGEVGALFALLRNWQLGAKLPITVRDGAVTVKGSHRMGDRRIFPKNLCASLFNDDLSLILAGSSRWIVPLNTHLAG
jgi:hypothetical protein